MPQITHGDVGDNWVPQATFTVGGVATDPTTVTVKIRDPAGTISTLGPVSGATGGGGIVRVSAGVFNTIVPITAAGYWYANFTGTGAAAAAEDFEYRADPSGFTSNWGLSTRALVGLGEAKDWLQSQNIDTAEDLDLVRVINDISDRFHQEAEREFKVDGTNPQTRTFIAEPLGNTRPWYIDGEYQGDINPTRRRIKIGDMASAPTQVQLMDYDWTTVLETVALADITALPSPRRASEPITELEFHSDVTSLASGMRVAVTGAWGFPSVPGDVRQAVLDAVAAVMNRDVEHYRQDLGVAGMEGEAGTVVYVGRAGGRMLAMPPSATAVAWRYRASTISVG
jgi:hypothetical protein